MEVWQICASIIVLCIIGYAIYALYGPSEEEAKSSFKPVPAMTPLRNGPWTAGKKDAEIDARFEQVSSWMKTAYPWDYEADKTYIMNYWSRMCPDAMSNNRPDTLAKLTMMRSKMTLNKGMNIWNDYVAKKSGWRCIYLKNLTDLDKYIGNAEARKIVMPASKGQYYYQICSPRVLGVTRAIKPVKVETFDGKLARDQLAQNDELFADERFEKISNFLFKCLSLDTDPNIDNKFTDLKLASRIKLAIDNFDGRIILPDDESMTEVKIPKKENIDEPVVKKVEIAEVADLDKLAKK